MKKHPVTLIIVLCLFIFYDCSNRQKDVIDAVKVDFGNIKTAKFSNLLVDIKYVSLETSNDILLSNIGKVEISDGYIYILDNYKANVIAVFSQDGKYINKLDSKGSGPGEFLIPHTFWIKNQDLFVLDISLNRLLKYDKYNLKFLEEIEMPSNIYPFSFALNDKEDVALYYVPRGWNEKANEKEIYFANKRGMIRSELLDTHVKKPIHGNPSCFYQYNGEVYFYPNFSDKIYMIDSNKIACKYQLSWGNKHFPDNDLFEKYADKSSGSIMDYLITATDNDIRLMYVYETNNYLVIKYYIQRDFYLSVWNKQTNSTVNLKQEAIIDDIGIGAMFPLPIGICGEQFVGAIMPANIEKDAVKDTCLLNIVNDVSIEDNPILVFYNYLQK